MRLMKRILSAAAVLALSASLLVGCSSGTASSVPVSASSAAESTVSSVEETASSAVDENEAAAAQLLNDLTGSYQELWPVILADEYKQTWLDDCTALVGEDNAEAAFEKLSSMVTGELAKPFTKYCCMLASNHTRNILSFFEDTGIPLTLDHVGFCGFTNSLAILTFDGETSTISGTDKDGNVLFSHTYHYIGMEPVRGLYEFQSDDADSGEFTYFFLAPDTSAETYHIEFRYGSDAEALSQYDTGEYAYWLASGISTDCDQTMIDNCIELFCTENLAG